MNWWYFAAGLFGGIAIFALGAVVGYYILAYRIFRNW